MECENRLYDEIIANFFMGQQHLRVKRGLCLKVRDQRIKSIRVDKGGFNNGGAFFCDTKFQILESPNILLR